LALGAASAARFYEQTYYSVKRDLLLTDFKYQPILNRPDLICET